MKIEVLYVSDCPSHPAAVQLVRDALNAERVAAEICEVLVSSQPMAAALKFPGSPTIRVNGRDVVAEDHTARFALACRLYPGLGPDSQPTGLPPATMVREAVREAQREAREGHRP